MKQSERVTEAIRWAHAQLSSMSKEELDKRLAARELGPVGRFLLETGAIRAMMDEKGFTPISFTIELPPEAFIPRSAADNDIWYVSSVSTPWTTAISGEQTLVAPGKTGIEGEQWAKAA